MRRAFSFRLLAFLGMSICPSVSGAADPVHVGKVVHIADGDTLTILVGQERLKIRLAEIDAPEKAQPYGNKAKKALGELAFGKQARVVEVDRDRYGRIVGRVYVGTLDVNAALVRLGVAWVYDRYATDQSLYRLQAEEYHTTVQANRLERRADSVVQRLAGLAGVPDETTTGVDSLAGEVRAVARELRRHNASLRGW